MKYFSREICIDLCENKQSHVFKIYSYNYMSEEYLYFIIVLKMKYLCINSFCHSRYDDRDALLQFNIGLSHN